MAGIGFELRRLLAAETFSGMLKGYVYASVVSSGSWLMSVLSLAALGTLTISFLGFEERQIFASSVVYMYAASLVGTGLTQMAITRYFSDRLYQGDRAALRDALGPVLLSTLLQQLAIAVVVLWGAPASLALKLALTATFLSVSLIWQLMTFLSASRDYLAIVLAFALGAAASVGAGLLWGRAYGLTGYVYGFGLGQLCIVSVLLLKQLREYGLPARWSWAFLGYLRRYPQLVVIGACYNLSVWIDKLLFGLSASGRVTLDRFPTYNHYDSSIFLAFAVMVPSMAIFLSRTETDFADAYKRYYDDIFFRRSYERILQSKRQMVDVLSRSFLLLIKVQGLITGIVFYFADDIIVGLSLPYSQTHIFRFVLVGSFLQVLMVFIQIVLLYFDLRGSVMGLTIFFLLANAGATGLSIELGFPYYGSGFACAALLGLAASVVVLYVKVSELEFITFARRKIVGQRPARRGDRARPGGLYGRYLPCPGREERR